MDARFTALGECRKIVIFMCILPPILKETGGFIFYMTTKELGS